ncbi:Tyrosine-protein kinase HCK [Portunus trituberculatus]|uniref:Tyrosine-protein kinase HCK n=1 Tax=Portunus trituberculatus TaxID=210409 RepID=A0A5B7E4N7_PORTR|nr:Tyrosine-protein kinase HCK [Portunus trituberculatus]
MAYLEEHDLLYFDLAVREILMTSDLVCKLRVCLSISTPQHVTSEDSLRFAPVIPELSACGSVTSKTCVWLFGMFMVEVVKGSPLHCHVFPFTPTLKNRFFLHPNLMNYNLPFTPTLNTAEYASNKDIVEQLRKGHGVPPPANCPKELYTLMKKCWIPSPEKRPSFAFLRNSLQEAAAGYTEEDVRMCLQDSYFTEQQGVTRTVQCSQMKGR